jgi:hypothetical protein
MFTLLAGLESVGVAVITTTILFGNF